MLEIGIEIPVSEFYEDITFLDQDAATTQRGRLPPLSAGPRSIPLGAHAPSFTEPRRVSALRVTLADAKHE